MMPARNGLKGKTRRGYRLMLSSRRALQASQPRNAYGWLAQRIGNVFSPAAYAAPVPQRPALPATPSLPSKADLNKQMRLMADALKFGILDPTKTEAENNKLQDVPVFTDADYKYPTGDSTVSDVTRVIKGALFNSRGDRLTLQEVEQLRAKVQSLSFSPEELKTLGIARKLNDIINQYGKKDDAMATALGIQVIANYNTRDGVLNKDGFKRDLAKYFVDQKWKAKQSDTNPSFMSQSLKKLHNIGESPLAASLFGRDRVGTNGWKDEYKEKGRSDINQAHHLAMFIISGIEFPGFLAEAESRVLDGSILYGENPADLKLSTLGIAIGQQIQSNKINIKNIQQLILNEIKEK